MSRFAVVGGGTTGAGWAARFLLNGWDVSVADVDILPVLEQARRVLPMLYECALPAEGRLILVDNAAEALRGADAAFVADAVTLTGISVFMAGSADPADPAYLLPFVRYQGGDRRAESVLASVGMAIGDPREQPRASETVQGDRDRVLVALLRALKREASGAGRVIAAHEATLIQDNPGTDTFITVRRVIPSDWTDYNGHMNESRYGQIWSDAADKVLLNVGVDAAYIARGLSYFTAETKTNFRDETIAGEHIRCETKVTLADGKKLRLLHEMRRQSDDKVLATCDQFLLHVSLETRLSCPPEPAVLTRLGAFRDRYRQTNHDKNDTNRR